MKSRGISVCDCRRQYSFGYAPTARKELGQHDRQVARRIARPISALGAHPRPAGCRRLIGYDELRRIRVGDCRVIYAIKDTELIVLALRIAHRSDVYPRI